MESKETDQLSNATATVISILAMACGPVLAAVIYSDMDSGIKPWLVALFVVLIIVLALLAMGRHKRFVRAWKEGNFELKIRYQKGHVTDLFILEERISELVNTFNNLVLPGFQNHFSAFHQYPEGQFRTVLSPNLLRACSNAILGVWTGTGETVDLLRPTRRAGLMKTSDLYVALNQMILLVEMIGSALKGMVEDVHVASDIDLNEPQFRRPGERYETFRQDYDALVERIRAYADKTSRLFGQEVHVSAPRLLPL